MCTYLDKVDATYYFRRAVPHELRPFILTKTGRPRTEWKISLGTKDRETAKRKLPDYVKMSDREIDAARICFGSAVASTAAPRPPMRELSEFDMEQMELRDQDEAERQARWDAREPLRQRLRTAFKRSTLEISPREAAMRDLLRDVQAELTLEQERSLIRRVERAEARRGISPPADTSGPTQSTGEAPHGATAQKDGTPTWVMLDTTIVDLWAAERKLPPQTVSMYRAAARWLYERIGRKAVRHLTKQDIVAFKTKLVEDGFTPSNIKTKLSRLRTLLQYAADNGYADSNAADGVTIKVTGKRKKARLPFDIHALNAIFGSPVYVDDVRPVAGCGEAAYWLPLLALFTGARREELGQLRTEDVVNLNYPDPDEGSRSAWFLRLIEVDDDEGGGAVVTKLKNEESERLVPVHPELERLGFIRFALAMKEQGRPRIFHQLRPNKFDVLTDAWGKWFTRYRRGACGINDRRLTFHSFRHTFIDYARRPDIPEGVQRQFVGHGGDDVHDTEYGTGYGLHWLVEGMKLYKVPGLKLPA